MKIAIWHNLPSGGAKRALYDQVQGLLARGHELEAWCPNTADTGFLPLSDLIPEHVIPIADPATYDRSFKDWIRTGPYEPDSQYRAMADHCVRCAEIINRKGFDLFFANTCVWYRAGPIGRFIDVPSLLYLQEPFRWLYESLPELPWLAPKIAGGILRPSIVQKKLLAADFKENRKNRILARQELESVKAYDRVLANSLYSRESMLKAYGIDAKVSYLGINCELFRYEEKPRENVVLGVGSFDRIKNIDFVIRAVAHLTELNPTLIWVGNSGEPDYRDELETLADSLGVDYRPRLMVPDHELVELMNTARVMAYAPRLEPFGLTPLEGNYCGLPVVGVAESGVRETITQKQNGILVEPEPSAMADALRVFLADPDYAERFGRQAREWVMENWGLEKSLDRLEQHLCEVAGKNRE